MGVFSMGKVRMSQMWMLRWVVLLVGLHWIHAEDPQDIMWLTTTAPTVHASNHVNSICSMWGNFHFKTFDGDFYQFPGTCEYNLVSECQSLIHQFSVHVKRTENSTGPEISRVSITISDITVKITKNQVMVNGENKTLPVRVAGIFVEESTIYIKFHSKMGITVMWNKEDAVMVKLDSKYSNRTCGLCGDFNGVPVYNEFMQLERKVGINEFGNKQKVPNPEHGCNEPSEENDEKNLVNQCEKHRADCEALLKDEDWFSCTEILDPGSYIEACMNDMCSYQPEDTDNSTVCATLSEYSRQCLHAGRTPPTWRRADFCAVTCPYNMVHSESGSPCMDTCLHKDTNALCEEHNIDGCFCPPGTVFDEISNTGCIPMENCQCKHDRIYNPGEVLHKKDEKCICKEGNWICMSIPGPGLCAVEEGSHFTTFDGKEFTFHGDCNYVLSKDCKKSKFIILGRIVPCVALNTDTCLKSILMLFNNDKNHHLLIKADGTVVQHNAMVSLPYITADFMVFMPSSFHIMLQTTFGLQVQVQLVPLMQVYITVDQRFQSKTCGLCGNFNKILSDDLKTPQGVVEGTAVSFANAWKAQSNCPDRTERMDDPCSYSSDSEHFAEYWCSKMKDKESLFAQCHVTVNPESYYKRCKYSTCTCEKSEDCLCAVFSSYARACAAKGIILQGWREIVCGKYTENCPASQIYSYKLQSCQRTCLSLASEHQSCRVNFVAVDGCACPDGLYQDENGLCIPMEQCPCYNNGVTVQPGKSIDIKNEHCVCVNGMFHCLSLKTSILECPAPKVFFNCSRALPDDHGLLCAQTCMQKEVGCFTQDCESGCQCPAGLMDDGRGNCVKPYECPCPHNGQFYAPGTEITVDCNSCTCQQGTWTCTENICPGICTIYGSGHYKTFDQKRFGFRGECSYIAVQDKCGNKTGFFHVITENIPCGTTGTTCSKAVIILLGRTKLQLSDETVKATDTGSGPQIKYKDRNIGMYFVIDTDIGLTVLWDRKTTVRIILQPQHMGDVCGLCGNFNGNGKDDFTTQGSLQTTDIIEFVDSWKVLGTCLDAAPDFDPCFETPNRVTWAKRECGIIKEATFKDCHNRVDPNPYYENCERDSCACDTGGDCECFCTAVAAYAQACNEAGVCVNWRTPKICPVYCDYYNKPEECTWHYSPCHTPCYKTCQNIDDICNNTLPHLEGCYPKCPVDKPIFDEQNQKCVKECCVGCYVSGTQYKPGEKIPTDKSCHECICNELCNKQCFQKPECCYYGGKEYADKDIIYTAKDHMEMCIYVVCINGTLITTQEPCTTTPSTFTTTSTTTTTHIPSTTTEIPSTTSTTTGTTPTSTVTTTSTTTTTTTHTPSTSTEIPCPYGYWSKWFNSDSGGQNDNETYEHIKESGNNICERPAIIECRNVGVENMIFDDFIKDTKQVVQCNVSSGLMCNKEQQTHAPFKCLDYEIRVCCAPPTPTPTSTVSVSTTPTSTVTTTSTIATTTTHTPSTTTEIPSTTSTTTGTTPTSTVTTTSTTTTTTTHTPSTTTEIPSTTSTTTGTTPTSTITTTSTTTTTTTTTHVPSTTTEIPSTTSTTTGTTPTSTVTNISTTTSTTTHTPSTSTEIPSTNSTSTGTTHASPSTKLCFCVVQGRQYKPGESILYKKNIGSGICLTMTCSITCAIQNSTELCPTPTPPPPKDCPKWNKTTNETFRISDCIMAKCIKGDVIEIVPLQCPPLKNITCTNHQATVLVKDEHQCCQQYACDCFCQGWGDPHYITFDGFAYTYQGNCTYILMEEIRPRYHLKIYIENVYCDIREPVSCPRSIFVSYNNQVITLRNHRFIGGANLEALKDKVGLKLPYTHDGVKVVKSSLHLTLEIPQLNVVVTFGITGFTINLPFQHFGNNTQGHCGTCNNNQADDCMIPGGILVNDCAVMADYWPASGVDGKNCTTPTALPTKIPTPKPTGTSRPAHPDCYLLMSNVFKACHSHIPPENFFLACQYDSSHMSNASQMVCASLQSYASACLQLGICIHWRNYTELCKIECPENKIFLPCGPSEPPTCRDGPTEGTIIVPTEGCFCPENTTLFSKESEYCVPKCGCVDPSGTPRVFNEHFKYSCEDCVCDMSSQSVICTHKKCPDVNPGSCTEPGFMLLNVTDPSDQCCSKQVCNCNASTCPDLNEKCAVGYEPVQQVLDGKCCPEIKCEPKEVCVYNNTEYKPGAKISAESCVECNCKMDKDPQTGLHNFSCSPIICPEIPSCSLGFKYEKKDGECCGSCTQDSCIYVAPDNTTHTLKVGEVHHYTCETVTCRQINDLFETEKTKTECPYSSYNCGLGFEYVKKKETCCGSCRQDSCIYDAPDKTRHILKDGEEYISKCMNATCLQRNGTFMTVERYKQCPPFNSTNCVPGTVRLDKDGCCQICETRNCVLMKNITRLHVNNCISIEDVEVTSCTGHCDNGSRYSMEMNIMMHSCSCCREEKVSYRNVTLQCTNSSEILHSYIYVDSCICTPIKCEDRKTPG